MDMIRITNIALYIPFLVLLAVFGIRFITAGYRKGTVRSLISLTATLAALVASIMIVRYCNGFLSQRVLSWQGLAVFQKMGALAQLVKAGIQSVLKVVVTFAVFAIALGICFTVLKWLAKLFTMGRVNSQQPGKAVTRLLGVGIGAVEALLATFILLLPLYGILAFAAPPAARVAPETQVLQTVQQHPMVALYSGQGANAVYQQINVFSIGGESADTEAFSAAVAGVMDYVEALRTPDGENSGRLAEGLSGFLKESITEGDLSYGMVDQLCSELENSTQGELESIFQDTTIGEALRGNDNGLLELVGDLLGGGFSVKMP